VSRWEARIPRRDVQPHAGRSAAPPGTPHTREREEAIGNLVGASSAWILRGPVARVNRRDFEVFEALGGPGGGSDSCVGGVHGESRCRFPLRSVFSRNLGFNDVLDIHQVSLAPDQDHCEIGAIILQNIKPLHLEKKCISPIIDFSKPVIHNVQRIYESLPQELKFIQTPSEIQEAYLQAWGWFTAQNAQLAKIFQQETSTWMINPRVYIPIVVFCRTINI